MTAGAVATPPTDMSMEADLGSLLTDAYNDATAEPTESAAPDAAADATPPGEAPSGPETTETPAPSTPGGEAPTSDYKLTEDGTSYLVPKTELPVFQGYKQYATELQPIFPTVTDAKTAYQDSSDLRAMMNDFFYGAEPDASGVVGIDAFVKHLAGFDELKDPAAKAQYQESFARMAERVPDVLKSINPEAHSKLVENFVGNQIESAYDKAKEFQDLATESGFPGDQRYADVMLQRAQQMEWGATGKVRGEYDAANGVYKYDFQKKAEQPQQSQVSPQQQQLDAREKIAFDRDYKYFDSTEFNGPMWKDYFADIDRALAPIKGKFSDMAVQAIREGINKQLLTDLNKDLEWSRMNNIERNAIQAAYKQLWKSGQSIATIKPRIAAYRADVLTRARQLLPSIAKAYINSVTATAVANNQQAQPARPQSQPTQRQVPAAPATQNGRRVPYSIHEDPEFNDAFKIPGLI